MITVKDLSHQYGNTNALKNISFHINPGEIIGLIGPNGAGKSTLMSLLTGIIGIQNGHCQIKGKSIKTHRQSLQTQIGYLSETNPLYSQLSVQEFLLFIAQARQLHHKQIPSAIKTSMQRCHLEEKANHPIHTLSKGYQQRVGIAQAIIHQPEILILDEPMNGLDPKQMRQIRSLITELQASCTIIISSHILSEIEELCPRLLILNKATLLADMATKELKKNNHHLESAFLSLIEGTL